MYFIKSGVVDCRSLVISRAKDIFLVSSGSSFNRRPGPSTEVIVNRYNERDCNEA